MKISRSLPAVLPILALCLQHGLVAQQPQELVAPVDDPAMATARVADVEKPQVLVTGPSGILVSYDLTNTVNCQTVTGTTRASTTVTNDMTFTASAAGTVIISYLAYFNIGSSPGSARRTGVFHSCDITDTTTGVTTLCPNDKFNLLYQASRGGTGTETATWMGSSENTLTYWWPGVSQSVPAQTFITGLTPGVTYRVKLGAYRQLVSSGTANSFASAFACVSSAMLTY